MRGSLMSPDHKPISRLEKFGCLFFVVLFLTIVSIVLFS